MQDPQVPSSAPDAGPESSPGRPCSFGVRAAAFGIDVMWILLLSMLIGALAGVWVGVVGLFAGRPFRFEEPAEGFFLVNGTLVVVLYFVLFEWLYGATPGKRRLHICVVRMDGAACGLLPALVRGVLRYVDGIFFGLVAFAAMRPPLYQRLGDRAARTLVVPVNSPLVREPREVGWYYAALVILVMLSAAATALLFLLLLR